MKTKNRTFINDNQIAKRIQSLKAQAIENVDVQMLAEQYATYRALYEVAIARAKDFPDLLAEQGQIAEKALGMLKEVQASNTVLRTIGPQLFDVGVDFQKIKIAKDKTEKAKKSINTRHDQPNGYRDIKTKVLQAWATGKYKTHVECATKAGLTFGIQIGTGIKYLRNAPKPCKPA